MHIRHETSSWLLTGDRFGFYTLTRKADNASAFFQGEDAALWERNMDALEAIEGKGGWRGGNTLDQTFDHLCSGYETVLQPASS